MKLVMALFKPYKLGSVHEALVEIGVTNHNATEVKGYDHQSDHAEVHRGTEYNIPFVSMAKIETVVADDMVERVIATIRQAAATGDPADGNIFVWETHNVVSIHPDTPSGDTP